VKTLTRCRTSFSFGSALVEKYDLNQCTVEVYKRVAAARWCGFERGPLPIENLLDDSYRLHAHPYVGSLCKGAMGSITIFFPLCSSPARPWCTLPFHSYSHG